MVGGSSLRDQSNLIGGYCQVLGAKADAGGDTECAGVGVWGSGPFDDGHDADDAEPLVPREHAAEAGEREAGPGAEVRAG